MFSATAIWAFLGGAKRWFTKEAGAAALVAVAVLAVIIGLACIRSDIKSGAEARVNWKWLTQLSELKRKRAERNAEINRNVAAAAAAERDAALKNLKDALESKTRLEAELATLKDNPVLYTRDERRRLFK